MSNIFRPQFPVLDEALLRHYTTRLGAVSPPTRDDAPDTLEDDDSEFDDDDEDMDDDESDSDESESGSEQR